LGEFTKQRQWCLLTCKLGQCSQRLHALGPLPACRPRGAQLARPGQQQRSAYRGPVGAGDAAQALPAAQVPHAGCAVFRACRGQPDMQGYTGCGCISQHVVEQCWLASLMQSKWLLLMKQHVHGNN
jgi:hypothetical protein